MRPTLVLVCIIFLFLVIETLIPITVGAQYFGQWANIFSPFSTLYPYFTAVPFTLYPIVYYTQPILPIIAPQPFIGEPAFRIANAPVTITIPTVSTTTPPVTAILNLIDPAVLASNVAVLTTNFPTVVDLLITTFQLPII